MRSRSPSSLILPLLLYHVPTPEHYTINSLPGLNNFNHYLFYSESCCLSSTIENSTTASMSYLSAPHAPRVSAKHEGSWHRSLSSLHRDFYRGCSFKHIVLLQHWSGICSLRYVRRRDIPSAFHKFLRLKVRPNALRQIPLEQRPVQCKETKHITALWRSLFSIDEGTLYVII